MFTIIIHQLSICLSFWRFIIDYIFLIKQLNRLPPEVVKYFTDPNAIEPPDMELLFPFVESALPLAYGVLGVLLFHVSKAVLLSVSFGYINAFHWKFFYYKMLHYVHYADLNLLCCFYFSLLLLLLF